MGTTLSDGDIEEAIWERLHWINAQLDPYEKIRKVAILSHAFPEHIRGITVLEKIKIDRRAVEESYPKEIEGIYAAPWNH